MHNMLSYSTSVAMLKHLKHALWTSKRDGRYHLHYIAMPVMVSEPPTDKPASTTPSEIIFDVRAFFFVCDEDEEEYLGFEEDADDDEGLDGDFEGLMYATPFCLALYSSTSWYISSASSFDKIPYSTAHSFAIQLSGFCSNKLS